MNDIQLQAVDKIVQRFSRIETKFSAKEISITPDGGISIRELVIENKATEEATKVESVLEKDSVKEVEREQFNWSWILAIKEAPSDLVARVFCFTYILCMQLLPIDPLVYLQ